MTRPNEKNIRYVGSGLLNIHLVNWSTLGNTLLPNSFRMPPLFLAHLSYRLAMRRFLSSRQCVKLCFVIIRDFVGLTPFLLVHMTLFSASAEDWREWSSGTGQEEALKKMTFNLDLRSIKTSDHHGKTKNNKLKNKLILILPKSINNRKINILTNVISISRENFDSSIWKFMCKKPLIFNSILLLAYLYNFNLITNIDRKTIGIYLYSYT